MTREDLQSLYDNLGNMRNVADYLGMSTADISPYLHEHGVVTRKRGGDWKKMPGARPTKITANAEANHAAGDYAFRARPVHREMCRHGVTCEGRVKPCCMPEEGHCEQCKAEHSLDSYSGAGASSSWTTEVIGAARGRQ